MGAARFFSSYFIVLILLVGMYLLFVQGPNLVNINHLTREGKLLRVIGGVFIAIGVCGILLWIFD